MLKIIFFISFIILDLLVTNSIYAETYNKSITTEENSSSSFNIVIAADWGCNENAKKPQKIFKRKIPNLLLEQEITVIPDL